MKKVFLMAVAMCVLGIFAGCNKHSYTLDGMLPAGTQFEKVYLLDLLSGEVLDSTDLVNSAFHFEGKAPDTATMALICVMPERRMALTSLVIEPGTLEMDTNTGVITGSPLNDALGQLLDTLTNANQTAGQNFESVYKTLMIDFCKEHNNDIAGAYILYTITPMIDVEDVQKLYENAGDMVKSSRFANDISDYLEKRLRSAVGQKFMEVNGFDLEGNPLTLSQFVGNGKYVLIDFWASWCAPCKEAISELKPIYKKYAGEKFEIVGITVNDDLIESKAAVAELAIPWQVLLDTKVEEIDQYGFQTIPQLILIAPDGTIADRDIQIDEMDSILNSYLNK